MMSQIKSTTQITLGSNGDGKKQFSVRSEGDGMESLKPSVNLETPQPSHDTFRIKPHLERSVICKEPKFIPYEPYKAAINPIVPVEKKKKKKSTGSSPSVEKMDELLKTDSNNCKSCDLVKQRYIVESSRWETQKEEMLSSIKKLKQEKKTLSSQLDDQIEVNREVKRLLVASVGEDLSARVHFLTEDKLKLAQNILQYSEVKVKDTELVEKLEVECDVWRSKFWALSMMVDELAHWKANLSSQLNESHSTMRCLLVEQQEVAKNVMEIYSLLKTASQVEEPNSASASLNCKTTLEMATDSRKLVSDLISTKSECEIEPLVPSYAEKKAMQILSQAELMHNEPPQSSRPPGCTTVMPRFRVGCKFEHVTFHCCPHCKGEISII